MLMLGSVTGRTVEGLAGNGIEAAAPAHPYSRLSAS
jgi:hypothetical protein